MACGKALKEEAGEMTGAEDGLDLESRVLCPDGNCTGIIIDGKCSECGKPHPGSAP